MSICLVQYCIFYNLCCKVQNTWQLDGEKFSYPLKETNDNLNRLKMTTDWLR